MAMHSGDTASRNSFVLLVRTGARQHEEEELVEDAEAISSVEGELGR
jgi:hypothetical protein